jgi:hypothetical protein
LGLLQSAAEELLEQIRVFAKISPQIAEIKILRVIGEIGDFGEF